jgi:hypothetical protein
MKTTANPLIFLICLWPLALLLVWAIWNARRDKKEEKLAERSQNWPKTGGKIVSSQVVWGYVEVKYEYLMDGKMFTGILDLNLPPALPSRGSNRTLERFNDEAKQNLRDYPVGAKIAVQYNPQRPEESYLSYVDGETIEKPSTPGFKCSNERGLSLIISIYFFSGFLAK